MDFCSELLTRNNVPPRVVLDETSVSMREVLESACYSIMHGNKLVYVWRCNAHQVSATSVALEQGVFIPIAKCARFWNKRKYSHDGAQFDVSQSVGLMMSGVLDKNNSFVSEFRVETFQRGMSRRYSDNFALCLDRDSLDRQKIQEEDLLLNNIHTYEYDCERGYSPHIDGTVKFLGHENIQLKKLNLRALAVHKGDGTRFWPDGLGEYGGEEAISDRNNVDPFCLQDKPSYHTKEGDIIIFNSKPVRLSHAFIHQARPSKSISTLQRPDIEGLRFVEVCDISVPVPWSPPI